MPAKHPMILWAQRSPHIYLSIEVEDLKIDDLLVEDDCFKIRGSRGDELYQADLKLYGKLLGAEHRQISTDRRVELIIPKEKSEWWPRLLHEKSKVAWIKVDFDKWVDEEDENENVDPFGDMQGGDFSQFADGFPMDFAGGPKFDDEDDEDIGELEDIDSEDVHDQDSADNNVLDKSIIDSASSENGKIKNSFA